MNISSVIVIPHPDRVEDVRRQLASIDGIEIHAVSPEGKMVVTLETDDDHAMIQTYERIGQLGGVLSVAMVYHRSEAEPDTEISVAAWPAGATATIQR